MDEKQRILQERLTNNFKQYMEELSEKPSDVLIDMAAEIAATKTVYEVLQDGCPDEYVECLLKFQKPLDLVREQWMDAMNCDYGEEMRHVLWNIQDKISDFLVDYAPAKPAMNLLGEDGNIYAIMGRASLLLAQSGQKEKVDEMFQRVIKCGSYEAALNIVSEYVETELSPVIQSQKSKPKKEKNAHER